MNGPTFVVINGYRMITQCSLTVEVETMDVTPATVTKPDYRWTLTDARGHFHAFSTDKEHPLPTLDRKTRERAIFDTDDEDEEPDIWEESYYVCRLCGQEMEPKWITNAVTWEERVPVRKSWKIELISRGELGSHHLMKWRNSLVTAVIETQDRHYFGIAFVEITTVESGTVHALLTGHGALGTRDA